MLNRVRFSTDIELFSKSIIQLIDDFCDHSTEFQQIESLCIDYEEERKIEREFDETELSKSFEKLKLKEEDDEYFA